jgi:hypothetical protein
MTPMGRHRPIGYMEMGLRLVQCNFTSCVQLCISQVNYSNPCAYHGTTYAFSILRTPRSLCFGSRCQMLPNSNLEHLSHALGKQ